MKNRFKVFAPLAIMMAVLFSAIVQATPIVSISVDAVVDETSPQITTVAYVPDAYILPDAPNVPDQKSQNAIAEELGMPGIVGGALNVNLVNNEIDKFQSQNTEVALAKDSDLLVNQNDTSPGNSIVDSIVQSDATKVKAYVDDSSGVAVNSSNFAQNNLLAATALEKDSGQQNLLNGNNKATGVIVFTSDQPKKART